MARHQSPKGESPTPPKPADREPSIHPIFDKIGRPELPFDPRKYVILVGYVGQVTDGYAWVYPRLNLTSYFKVPLKGAYWESLYSDQPWSPTIFVIQASAEVEVVKQRNVEAGFLTGPIAAANLCCAAPRTEICEYDVVFGPPSTNCRDGNWQCVSMPP